MLKLKPRSSRMLRPKLLAWLIRQALLASCVMMVGCATKPAPRPDYCAPWKPIYVSRVDVLSDGTARAIRDHDETGVHLGCWPAPAKVAPKK